MASIADSLVLPCGATLKNRIFNASMTEGLANADNNATERHARLYRMWAEGGAGIVCTGNVQVDRRYLERAGNVAIDGKQSPEALKGLREWAKAGTANGAHLWMQISHPGRQTTKAINSQPLAPSAVQLRLLSNFGMPRALESSEIEDVIKRFVHTALVARDTGFTGVQIHSAHGYLLSSFLSPDINQRKDKWGGSLENRVRLLLEIIRSVRKEVGDGFPISVKLNSADYQKGGFNHEDALQVARWLDEASVDLLEISGGTYERVALFGLEDGLDPKRAEKLQPSTIAREAYFLKFAEDIRKGTKMPLAVTGGFRTLKAMNAALESKACDIVGMARPFCTETDIANKLLSGDREMTDHFEDILQLGPTRFLGPNSPIRMIKILNTFSLLYWYYEQLVSLADIGKTNKSLSLFKALRIQSAREAAQIKALTPR